MVNESDLAINMYKKREERGRVRWACRQAALRLDAPGSRPGSTGSYWETELHFTQGRLNSEDPRSKPSHARISLGTPQQTIPPRGPPPSGVRADAQARLQVPEGAAQRHVQAHRRAIRDEGQPQEGPQPEGRARACFCLPFPPGPCGATPVAKVKGTICILALRRYCDEEGLRRYCGVSFQR